MLHWQGCWELNDLKCDVILTFWSFKLYSNNWWLISANIFEWEIKCWKTTARWIIYWAKIFNICWTFTFARNPNQISLFQMKMLILFYLFAKFIILKCFDLLRAHLWCLWLPVSKIVASYYTVHDLFLQVFEIPRFRWKHVESNCKSVWLKIWFFSIKQFQKTQHQMQCESNNKWKWMKLKQLYLIQFQENAWFLLWKTIFSFCFTRWAIFQCFNFKWTIFSILCWPIKITSVIHVLFSFWFSIFYFRIV